MTAWNRLVLAKYSHVDSGEDAPENGAKIGEGANFIVCLFVSFRVFACLLICLFVFLLFSSHSSLPFAQILTT